MAKEDTGTIQERLYRVLESELGADPTQIKPENNLKEDLGADSLDATEVIMKLEEEFDIEIGDDDAEKMTTVQNILNYLEKKLAQ